MSDAEYRMTLTLLFFIAIISVIIMDKGARGSAVVKALCYKPEGRWFDTR
jgi:hypothetical protein